MKSIQVTDEQYNLIKELAKHRKTQDNMGTNNPIWLVQTEVSRAFNDDVIPDGHRFEMKLFCSEGEVASENDDLDKIKEGILESVYNTFEIVDNECDEIKELKDVCNLQGLKDWYELYITEDVYLMCVEYYYKTVAYFLTDVEAKRYLNYQSHNLSNPRIYVDHTGYNNYGYLPKLMDLLLNIDIE